MQAWSSISFYIIEFLYNVSNMLIHTVISNRNTKHFQDLRVPYQPFTVGRLKSFWPLEHVLEWIILIFLSRLFYYIKLYHQVSVHLNSKNFSWITTYLHTINFTVNIYSKSFVSSAKIHKLFSRVYRGKNYVIDSP